MEQTVTMVFRLCFIYFLAAAGIVTAAVTSRSDVNGSLTPLNVTELGAIPEVDPYFSIVSKLGLPVLPGIPCLMNAVNAMQDLALEDFNEPLVPITYMLDNFPEVMIAPEAIAEGGAIQTRFIIWGLWMGLTGMMDRGLFHTAVITLQYRGVAVGYIRIARPGTQLIFAGSNDTKGLSQRSVDRRRPSQTMTTPLEEIHDKQLTTSFNPIEPSLSGSDVLMAILYTLVYAARFPGTQTAGPFKLSLPKPYSMHVDIFNLGGPAPPFLEYRWIIMSLSQIPRYMLQQRRFSGVSLKMRIGRITVGEGSLFQMG